MPKHYDRAFKLLAEEDPRAILALFAGIPLSAKLTVEPVGHELNIPALQVDKLYRCRDEKQEFLIHIEVVSCFKRAALDRQFDYVQAIVAKYKRPCRSYLVLLSERGVPAEFPRQLRRVHGDHVATLRLRVVRLWHISAARILRLGNLQFLPWVPLLDATPADLDEAFARLKANHEVGLSADLVLHGGLRYGSKEAFLQRLNQMIISEEILKTSATYKFIEELGRQRGLAEGGVQALRETLAKLLTRRFGPLPVSAKTKLKSATRDKLEQWLDGVLDAPTLKDALK